MISTQSKQNLLIIMEWHLKPNNTYNGKVSKYKYSRYPVFYALFNTYPHVATCLYLPRPSKSSQGHNRHSRLSPSPFRWRNKYKVDALHHCPLPHAATVCFSVFYVCVYLLHTYIYIEREGLWEVEAQCGCGLFWISFTEIVCGGKIFFRRFLLR